MPDLSSQWDFETTTSGMLVFLAALVRTIRGASPASRQIFLAQLKQEIDQLVAADESLTSGDAQDTHRIYNRVLWNVNRRPSAPSCNVNVD